MDNQQGKVSEVDIAWLAGFIDGEGCIDFQKAYAHRLTNNRIRPRLRISNTHIDTLNTVTRIMDSMRAGQNVGWRTPQNAKWRKSWDVDISGFKRMHRFLIQITPYLHTKKVQAEAMLDFINSRMERSQKELYSENEITLINKVKMRKTPLL